MPYHERQRHHARSLHQYLPVMFLSGHLLRLGRWKQAGLYQLALLEVSVSSSSLTALGMRALTAAMAAML
jgi:hypothetical protein